MNAYELAEQAEGLAYEIPADWSSGEPKNVATDIADMLRQQADRIAELEHMNRNWQLSETMAYNRIAELEKDLEGCEYFLDKQESAEPVAWINQNIEVENGKPQLAWHKDNFAEICKPLYTTPHHASDAKQIKELSDEEIYKLAGEFWIEGWTMLGLLEQY